MRRQNTKNKYISIQLTNFPISKSLRTNLAHIIEDINCAKLQGWILRSLKYYDDIMKTRNLEF